MNFGYCEIRFHATPVILVSGEMIFLYEANMLRVISLWNAFECVVTFCVLVRWMPPVVLRERYVVLCGSKNKPLYPN